MDKGTIDHIKLLTKLDTKTLSERVLKLFEEGGELARAVLPYENVSSTRHRFTEKNQILEEVIDALLVSYSIAYHMDFTEDDINEMLKLKLAKWNNILTKEQKTNGKPIPFEIHITLEIDSLDIPSFQAVCKAIEVKPIVLALQKSDLSDISQDVMTSSTVLGTNRDAYLEALRISEMLEKGGFKVVRKKIETVPWHPAAPSQEGDLMPKDCYFESHVAVKTSSDRKYRLSELADRHGAHMSKNVFKIIDENNFIQMMTIRWHEGIFSDFDNKVDMFIEDLKSEGFELDRKIVEFSVYDTKINHDSTWITN